MTTTREDIVRTLVFVCISSALLAGLASGIILWGLSSFLIRSLDLLTVGVLCGATCGVGALVSTVCWWRLIIKPRRLTNDRAIAAGIISSLITYMLAPIVGFGLPGVLQGQNVLEAIGFSVFAAIWVLPFVGIPIVIAGVLCGLLLASIQRGVSRCCRWRLVPLPEIQAEFIDNLH